MDADDSGSAGALDALGLSPPVQQRELHPRFKGAVRGGTGVGALGLQRFGEVPFGVGMVLGHGRPASSPSPARSASRIWRWDSATTFAVPFGRWKPPLYSVSLTPQNRSTNARATRLPLTAIK